MKITHLVQKVHNRKFQLRILSMSALTIMYICNLLVYTAPVSAQAAPGGDVLNPIVRAVDLAKPAVVRIITSQKGRITVHFPTSQNTTVTFPQNGSSYDVKLSGSGTFISAHGDILTADHVIKPPHDQSLDQALQSQAAQDVADYVNQNLNPSINWTADDATGALSSSYLLSETSYDKPTSVVYYSTDFTGKPGGNSLDTLPPGSSAPVDHVEAESAFDEKDVAIVHVALDNTPSVQLGDSTDVAQQNELTIIGFPGNGDLGNSNGTNENPATFLVSSVNKIYVSAIKTTDAGAPVIQVGGNVEHGDSGGPAIDSKGNIVGTVSFGGSDMPDGTSFLQASNSAKDLVTEISLDTTPGTLEKAWTKAFNQYATSKAPNHWHQAQKVFNQIVNTYPSFGTASDYLDYINLKAEQEKLPKANPETSTDNGNNWGLILGLILLVIVLLGATIIVLIAFNRRKKKQANQAVLAAASYGPYPTNPINNGPSTQDAYKPYNAYAAYNQPTGSSMAASPGVQQTPMSVKTGTAAEIQRTPTGVGTPPPPPPPTTESATIEQATATEKTMQDRQKDNIYASTYPTLAERTITTDRDRDAAFSDTRPRQAVFKDGESTLLNEPTLKNSDPTAAAMGRPTNAEVVPRFTYDSQPEIEDKGSSFMDAPTTQARRTFDTGYAGRPASEQEERTYKPQE